MLYYGFSCWYPLLRNLMVKLRDLSIYLSKQHCKNILSHKIKKNMFQAQGLDSGQIDVKTPKLSTQQILKQAPKTTEVETLSTMGGELHEGQRPLDKQSAMVKQHMISFERNTNPSLTFGVSNKKLTRGVGIDL